MAKDEERSLKLMRPSLDTREGAVKDIRNRTTADLQYIREVDMKDPAGVAFTMVNVLLLSDIVGEETRAFFNNFLDHPTGRKFDEDEAKLREFIERVKIIDPSLGAERLLEMTSEVVSATLAYMQRRGSAFVERVRDSQKSPASREHGRTLGSRVRQMVQVLHLPFGFFDSKEEE